MTGFVEQLDQINAIADNAPGFIWRLQTEAGDATSIQVSDDPRLLVNMSVWENVESLRNFVYRSGHVTPLRDRAKWFEPLGERHMVLWWVPMGHEPDLEEAQSRLALLRERGSHCQAFDFSRPFPPPIYPDGFVWAGQFATRRQYQTLDNQTGEVSLDGSTFRVPHDSFWPRFARGWEPESARLYESTVAPGSVVLDIGAWIGPTILFALARGAERIIALEPNPESFSALERLLSLNPELASRVTLVNAALSNSPGNLSMGMPMDDDDSSRFGLGGKGIEVRSVTLPQLMGEVSVTAPDLVKIDIEGAEALLARDLESLSRRRGQVVHLSVHVPLFPLDVDRDLFASSLAGFIAYDDRGEALSTEELRRRITSEDSHPFWGTRHGNYFELILIGAGSDPGLADVAD